MGQRPSFGSLRKPKPATVAATAPAESPLPAAAKRDTRIQTSVRLEPPLWAALNDLATRKRVETQKRITVHDLLIEGARHMLAVNGIKLSE